MASWIMILDALCDAFPEARIALIGKLRADERTSSSLSRTEVDTLLAHTSEPVDCFAMTLLEQLAVAEACDVFISPHTGFGMAVLAVATPWLTISGGPWIEYFFNRVPFRSLIPDVGQFPAYWAFDSGPALVPSDDGEGPRTPSMSAARIRHDLGRLVRAAEELISGRLEYEQALEDYFRELVSARGGADGIWSIDGVHLPYV
jgi:hypothetical protein